jgi:hypothetical protein
MKFRNLAAAAAAMTLVAAPVVAQAAPQRAAAPVEEGSDATASTYIIAFFAILAIGLGIYFATKNNDDPVSP